MARWLKQSTSVDVPIGPFVDATDGVTAETALTITQPDIRLKKNGGAWAQKAAAQTLSHEENGYYEVTLDATDTNTLGLLRLAVNESGALPVWEDFIVVAANVYDSLIGGGDVLDVSTTQFNGSAVVQSGGRPEVNLTHIAGSAVSTTTAQLGVNVVQLSGDATAADNAEAFFDGTGYAGTNNVIPTVTTVNGLAANVITAAATAADFGTEVAAAVWAEALPGAYGAGTAGKIIGDNVNATISSRATQTSVDTVDDLLDTEVAAIFNRIGAPVGASISADIAAVKAQTAAIETDTAEIGAAGAGLTALATQASVNTIDDFLDTEIAAIKTETDKIASIKSKTDSLTFTVAGQVDANVQSINDVTITGNGQVGTEFGV